MTKERRKESSTPSRTHGSIEPTSEGGSDYEGPVTEHSDSDQRILKDPTQIAAGIEDQRKEKPEETVLDGTVLMVDQLWLWALESSTAPLVMAMIADDLLLIESANTTVTFFPRVCDKWTQHFTITYDTLIFL